MDYVGHQTWFTVDYVKGEYGSFLHEFIHYGHAFLLFDGLDEVSNYNEREKIVHLIEVFLEKYVQTPGHISINDEREVIDKWGRLRCE
jgi:predicted NACHT family NTPase